MCTRKSMTRWTGVLRRFAVRRLAVGAEDEAALAANVLPATRRMHRVTACAALVAMLNLAACTSPDSTPPKKGPIVAVDPATAGTIEVQVDYSGAPPTASVINMAGTPACAALHPQPVPAQTLLVQDGHLANAVVYIQSGLGDRAFATPETAVLLDQQGCLYVPHVVALMVGQPLEIRNSDPEAHNVHGRPRVLDAWNFLMSRPGSSRTLRFDREEVGVPVGCDIHPWMRAYISVFDHPYFAVTPASGQATLGNVPPGEYVVAAWHEALGTRVQPVTVPKSGTASVRFTFQPAER